MTDITQGTCHDGAAILKDGRPLTIEQLMEAVRILDDLRTWDTNNAFTRGENLKLATPIALRKRINNILES